MDGSAARVFGCSHRVFGTAVTILGVLALCPDTLMLREVEDANDWTVIFFRALFFGAFMTAFQLLHDGSPQRTLNTFYALGSLGLAAGTLQGASQLFFTLAVQNTAVANVLVINSTNPIFSAIFSVFILKERIPWKTVIVIFICFGAILVVFSNELGSGSSSSSAFVGNLFALAAACTVGLYFVLVRLATMRYESADMLPCNIVSGVVMSLVAVAIGQGLTPLTSRDYGLLVAQGLGLAVSFGLLTIGPAYISAPEVSLYTLIETIIAPVYVYLAGYEAPPQNTIYGGIMILVALFGHRYVAAKCSKSHFITDLAFFRYERNTTR